MVNYCGQLSLNSDASEIANWLANALFSDRFCKVSYEKNVLCLDRIKVQVANTLKRAAEYFYLNMYEYNEVGFNDLLQRVDVRLIFGNYNRFSAFKRYFTIELPSGVTPRLRLYICRLRRYDWLKHRIGFKGELEFNGFDAIFIEMWQNLPEVIRSIDSDILEKGGSDPNNTSITTVFFTTEDWKREFIRLFDKSLLIG